MRHAISSSGAFVGPILVRLLSAPNWMIYAMASFARFRACCSRSMHHVWMRTILVQRETIWKLAGAAFGPGLAGSGMCHRHTLGCGSPGA